MHITDTFADKAAEGKSKVLEIGVYILETLGSVGLPAEQVAATLLSFRATKEQKPMKKRRTKRRKKVTSSNTSVTSTSSSVSNKRSGRSREGETDLLTRALRFVIEAGTSSPQQVISRILFYLADALGETLDKPSKRDLERAVGAFVEEAHCHRGRSVKLERIPQPLCRAVTGVVLSYQERDDLVLPSHTLNRIRRGMHFDIPIRPFDATVQLLPMRQIKNRRVEQLRLCDGDENMLLEEEEEDKMFQQEMEDMDRMGRMMAYTRGRQARLSPASVIANSSANPGSYAVVPCTPQSFPPTPESRTQLMGDYSEFTENVLWRARDELRGEQQDNDRSRMAIFNPEDAHPKVLLSCGGHCASLEHRLTRRTDDNQQQQQQHVQRIYRSVRAALAFQNGKTTYFEICPVWCGPNTPELEMHTMPLHLCVGISTRAMSLRNTVPGCSQRTIGLDSSGVMLLSGRRTRTTGFTYGSVIGVCVRTLPTHLVVGFFIDGKPVSCDANDLCDQDNVESKDTWKTFTIPLDGSSQYYPTISLKSGHVKVFGHFSAADMRHPESDTDFWSCVADFSEGEQLQALDGTRLLTGDTGSLA